MLREKILPLILLFAVTAAIAEAQQPLTLEQCRQLALGNNKALKAATEQERAAHYMKKEALSKFFPKVSASATYLHFGNNLYLVSDGAIPTSISLPAALGGQTIPIPDQLRDAIHKAGEIDIANNWLMGVNLTQPIFAGGKIIAYNDLRAYALDLASAMKETKTADVIVETDEAYWQIVSLSSKKKLAQAYVDLLTKLCSDMEHLVEEGMATKADKLSVDVKLNEAELSLTKVENGLSLSKMLLCQLCGIEIADNISVVDENIELSANTSNSSEVFDVEQVIEQRSEIKSLGLAVKIAEQQQKIAFAEYLPTLGVTTGYSWINPNMNDGIQHKLGGMWDIGVSLSIPLNFFSSSANHNAAKAQTRKAQYELDDTKEKVRLQINQSSYKLAEANKKMVAATKNTERANENLRYANAGFEEGVIPASDVLAAHAAWISSHAEMIDARIDQRLCKLYLNKALGRSLKE